MVWDTPHKGFSADAFLNPHHGAGDIVQSEVQALATVSEGLELEFSTCREPLRTGTEGALEQFLKSEAHLSDFLTQLTRVTGRILEEALVDATRAVGAGFSENLAALDRRLTDRLLLAEEKLAVLQLAILSGRLAAMEPSDVEYLPELDTTEQSRLAELRLPSSTEASSNEWGVTENQTVPDPDGAPRHEEPVLLQELASRVQSAEARIAGISTVSTSAWERVGQLCQTVNALGQEAEGKAKAELQVSELVKRMKDSETHIELLSQQWWTHRENTASTNRSVESLREELRVLKLESSVGHVVFVPQPQVKPEAGSSSPSTPTTSTCKLFDPLESTETSQGSLTESGGSGADLNGEYPLSKEEVGATIWSPDHDMPRTVHTVQGSFPESDSKDFKPPSDMVSTVPSQVRSQRTPRGVESECGQGADERDPVHGRSSSRGRSPNSSQKGGAQISVGSGAPRVKGSSPDGFSKSLEPAKTRSQSSKSSSQGHVGLHGAKSSSPGGRSLQATESSPDRLRSPGPGKAPGRRCIQEKCK
mmetsp:Transcript_53256/g.142520  ORF Transcript_53256/g.142520 Transcript_53256/m.142520 type:complete len:534 (-) Transcript_53256:332-1933(-)